VRNYNFKQLGEKLKSSREAKDMTLEEIAARTKINISFLENFENGVFDFLPEFYTRNFLKLYLKQIGASAKMLFFEYEEIRNSANQNAEGNGKIEMSDSRFSKQLISLFKRKWQESLNHF